MGWNKCNKFLLKKNKGQGVLLKINNYNLKGLFFAIKKTLFVGRI